MEDALIPAITGVVGLLGVGIGGFITWQIERMKLRTEIAESDRRKQLEDLRLFQESVQEVVDAIEHDWGEFDQLRRRGEDFSGWISERTYRARQMADKRAVWVREDALAGRWKTIRTNTADIQARIETFRMRDRFSGGSDALNVVDEIYAESYDQIASNRKELEALYEDLRTSSLIEKMPAVDNLSAQR